MARKNASAAILDAAKACMIDGDGSFEMMDVATKAGVSEGLAYHYFKSKAGLVSAILRDFYQRYHDVMNERVPSHIDFRLRERERLNHIIGFIYQEPLSAIIFGQMQGTAEAEAVDREMQQATIALSIRNLQSGIAQGVIPERVDAELAAAAIMGLVRACTVAALTKQPRPDQAYVTDQLWQMISAILQLKDAE